MASSTIIDNDELEDTNDVFEADTEDDEEEDEEEDTNDVFEADTEDDEHKDESSTVPKEALKVSKSKVNMEEIHSAIQDILAETPAESISKRSINKKLETRFSKEFIIRCLEQGVKSKHWEKEKQSFKIISNIPKTNIPIKTKKKVPSKEAPAKKSKKSPSSSLQMVIEPKEDIESKSKSKKDAKSKSKKDAKSKKNIPELEIPQTFTPKVVEETLILDDEDDTLVEVEDDEDSDIIEFEVNEEPLTINGMQYWWQEETNNLYQVASDGNMEYMGRKTIDGIDFEASEI